MRPTHFHSFVCLNLEIDEIKVEIDDSRKFV
jgi:hypothetical protein